MPIFVYFEETSDHYTKVIKTHVRGPGADDFTETIETHVVKTDTTVTKRLKLGWSWPAHLLVF